MNRNILVIGSLYNEDILKEENLEWVLYILNKDFLVV